MAHFSLRILSGIHAGAFSLVDKSPILVGSDASADISLLDDGVEPHHVRIEQVNPNRLSITALADGVELNDTILAREETREITLPAVMQLGVVSLSLEPDQIVSNLDEALEEQGQSGKNFPVLDYFKALNTTVLLVGIIGVFLIGILVDVLWRPSAITKPEHAQTSELSASVTKNVTKPDADVPLSDDKLGKIVVAALNQAHFSSLKVMVGTGVVTVEGIIPQEQMARFRNVEQWFDATYGARYVWLPNITQKSQTVPLNLPIQAVWDGDNPNIVMHGQRYRIGSELVTGMSLLDITKHGVIVSQGSQTVTIRY
ncbi:SctD/MshK family protein [Kozakia baliensis]|nr:EscD/YscD/HrpQ family type III secretion system periplasmic domain-containing protein [Kozakia baliensis]